MNDTPGYSTAGSKRPLDSARWPVLARLPDASADPVAPRPIRQSKPSATEYRFDPAQSRKASSLSAASAQSAIRGSVKLAGANPKSAITQPPHVFERSRPGTRRIPRRESPILPRSNPFSNPRERLIDSLAPAVRFLTMVALFTAAGIWFQMTGHSSSRHAELTEPTRAAAQSAVAPAKNEVERAVPPPTAAGPLNSAPKSGARVGRANGDDFASRDQRAAQTVPVNRPAATPPHFIVAGAGPLPRVQTTEPQSAEVASPADSGDSERNTRSEESPAVARYPGFLIDIPTR